jgi:oxaloacetate decarboxylase (Na+ extruding) subunit alpha
MVTPLSQFVGSQAALNVIVGERYKEVTDQVIRYALGRAGREGAQLMDPNVKDKILARPRAKEIAAREPVESTIDEMRSKLGGPGVSDEELLLRWLLSEEEIAAMRAAAPPQAYVSTRAPVVTLLEELTKRADVGQIKVQKGDVSVTLEKRKESYHVEPRTH